MQALQTRPAAETLAPRRKVDAADVIALLREVYADGVGTREEAEELIAFDLSLAERSPGWTSFFSETLSDHLLRRQDPASIVDDDKADWLIGALSRGRHAATPGAFDAILRVIETARDISPKLTAYAIRQVRAVVIAGREPASGVRLYRRRSIDAECAALVRRIVLGCPGLAARPVSRDEAEALFDLHDLAAGDTNDTGFDDLFFRAVANHLLGRSQVNAVARARALAAERSYPSPDELVHPLGADDGAWLASQIMRDGRATAAEFALLQFFSGGSDAASATQAA